MSINHTTSHIYHWLHLERIILFHIIFPLWYFCFMISIFSKSYSREFGQILFFLLIYELNTPTTRYLPHTLSKINPSKEIKRHNHSSNDKRSTAPKNVASLAKSFVNVSSQSLFQVAIWVDARYRWRADCGFADHSRGFQWVFCMSLEDESTNTIGWLFYSRGFN